MTVCKEWHRILSDVSLKSVMSAAVEQYAIVRTTLFFLTKLALMCCCRRVKVKRKLIFWTHVTLS